MNANGTPTRFGVSWVPILQNKVSPTLQLERGLQLAEWIEELGYEEFFTGEHHSVGHEVVGHPEMFLAAAAQRTKQLKLGTGVISLPYHNPFMVADRAVQLDHLTRGRAIIGVGPGSLTSDAHMLGLDVAESRNRMAEALEVIVRLLEGEVVTEKSDWYDLRDARLHMNSYRQPRVEMMAACIASPTGPKAAGKYGMGMINLAAASEAAFEAMKGHWEICEAEAAKAGRTVSRDDWRLSSLLHLAESEAEARENLKKGGFVEMMNYLGKVSILPQLHGDTHDEIIDSALEQSVVTIGTPDTAIEMIDRFAEQTGGFGSYVFSYVEFVSHQAQMRSLELFAEYVIPHFRNQIAPREASERWVLEDLKGGRKEWEDAIVKATAQYEAERGGPPTVG